GHHQHAVVSPQHLVVHVHAHHGVGAHGRRPALHLLNGLGSGSQQLLLIGSGPTAEEVSHAGGKVLQEIHSRHHLSEHDSLILYDLSALHRRGCGNNHAFSSFSHLCWFFLSVGWICEADLAS